jgi:hypothetical protein
MTQAQYDLHNQRQLMQSVDGAASMIEHPLPHTNVKAWQGVMQGYRDRALAVVADCDIAISFKPNSPYVPGWKEIKQEYVEIAEYANGFVEEVK